MDETRISRIVRDLLVERFGERRIVSVSVSEDQVFEGEDILRVQVVVEPEAGPLDPREINSAVGRLRPRLQEAGVDVYPLISFVARPEVEDVS